MIYNFKNGFINKDNFESVEIDGINYLYSGLIYLFGIGAGRDSILKIHEEYLKLGVVQFDKIYGAYNLIIEKKKM